MEPLISKFDWQKKNQMYKNIWEQELELIATSLAKELKEIWGKYIIGLRWDLGMGKTTFARAFIRSYEDTPMLEVTSPTYTYYKLYPNVSHFDLYRLEEYNHFVALGWEEYLDAATIALVEWPDLIKDYYWFDIMIELSGERDGERRDIQIITNNINESFH